MRDPFEHQATCRKFAIQMTVTVEDYATQGTCCFSRSCLLCKAIPAASSQQSNRAGEGVLWKRLEGLVVLLWMDDRHCAGTG